MTWALFPLPKQGIGRGRKARAIESGDAITRLTGEEGYEGQLINSSSPVGNKQGSERDELMKKERRPLEDSSSSGILVFLSLGLR